jgi:hypothetical protein
MAERIVLRVEHETKAGDPEKLNLGQTINNRIFCPVTCIYVGVENAKELGQVDYSLARLPVYLTLSETELQEGHVLEPGAIGLRGTSRALLHARSPIG